MVGEECSDEPCASKKKKKKKEKVFVLYLLLFYNFEIVQKPTIKNE